MYSTTCIITIKEKSTFRAKAKWKSTTGFRFKKRLENEWAFDTCIETQLLFLPFFTLK